MLLYNPEGSGSKESHQDALGSPQPAASLFGRPTAIGRNRAPVSRVRSWADDGAARGLAAIGAVVGSLDVASGRGRHAVEVTLGFAACCNSGRDHSGTRQDNGGPAPDTHLGKPTLPTWIVYSRNALARPRGTPGFVVAVNCESRNSSGPSPVRFGGARSVDSCATAPGCAPRSPARLAPRGKLCRAAWPHSRRGPLDREAPCGGSSPRRARARSPSRRPFGQASRLAEGRDNTRVGPALPGPLARPH